jgi:drug/metabolite transporter (DMT)-like permease
MSTPLPISVHSNISGYLAILTAASFWATSGIFIKLIMNNSQVSAIVLAFWRDTAAFSVFFFLHLALYGRHSGVKRSDWPWVIALGISLGLFHVGLNIGVFLNGAAVTTIQQAAMPAIVLMAERIIWREPLTRQKIVSLFLIFSGAVLISGLTEIGEMDVTMAGVLAGFCIPSLYAAWSLLGKQLRKSYSALPILTYAFGIAMVVLFPLQFNETHPWPVAENTWLWFAGLVGLSTVGGFLVYTFGLGRLSAGVVTIVAMSEIVFSAVLAYIYLNETLTLTETVGALVIIAGIACLFVPNGVLRLHKSQHLTDS